MARALAAVHRLDGSGLEQVAFAPPRGDGRLVVRARHEWSRLDGGARVLTHRDFWCGNAVWDGPTLVGVIGSTGAAEHFLRRYEDLAACRIPDVHAWDLVAAARADHDVESWATNYHGIGRPELTSAVLRERFDEWTALLLADR